MHSVLSDESHHQRVNMSAYRAYGSASTGTPPQTAQRAPSSSQYGYTGYQASPGPQAQSTQSTGFQSYGGQPQQGYQQSQQPLAGSSSGWNAQNSYGPVQGSHTQASNTPQGPKQFSWGLPIQNYTPKSTGDDAHSGSPESPRHSHGTPNHTPNRPVNPLYPTFDVDDEAPPRESTLGLDDDDMVSSPPTAAPISQLPKQQTAPAQQSSYSVIVFGFSPASQQLVLQTFRGLGEVAEVQQAGQSGANWFTISYKKQWDASLAIRKSGDVIAGTMIGVKWANSASAEAPATSGAAPTHANAIATPSRPPPPLGERVNVLSAQEALKRPTAQASPGGGMLAKFTGAGNSNNAIAPASPHASLFKQPQTPNRGWSSTLSTLVFGE